MRIAPPGRLPPFNQLLCASDSAKPAVAKKKAASVEAALFKIQPEQTGMSSLYSRAVSAALM